MPIEEYYPAVLSATFGYRKSHCIRLQFVHLRSSRVASLNYTSHSSPPPPSYCTVSAIGFLKAHRLFLCRWAICILLRKQRLGWRRCCWDKSHQGISRRKDLWFHPEATLLRVCSPLIREMGRRRCQLVPWKKKQVSKTQKNDFCGWGTHTEHTVKAFEIFIVWLNKTYTFKTIIFGRRFPEVDHFSSAGIHGYIRCWRFYFQSCSHVFLTWIYVLIFQWAGPVSLQYAQSTNIPVFASLIISSWPMPVLPLLKIQFIASFPATLNILHVSTHQSHNHSVYGMVEEELDKSLRIILPMQMLALWMESVDF